MRCCMNKICMGLLLGLFLPALAAGAGQIYYVGMAGSDAHAGSRTSPFATIQAAVDRVKPGDTVVVMEGTYDGARISVSGKADAYITLRADDNARVVLKSPGAKNRRNEIGRASCRERVSIRV